MRIGEGVIGMAAARVEPMRVGNLGQMLAYARTVRRSYEESGTEAPGQEIPLPGLAAAESQVAVPAVVLGQLVGVLVIESPQQARVHAGRRSAAHGRRDPRRERDRDRLGAGAGRGRRRSARRRAPVRPRASAPTTRVRFFAVDGSTFLDGEYLIKGVAGRILWALLGQYTADGRDEFTNKEVRLDPSLELPEFRDNLESRLILLKRRLDERDAPIRIEKTGRGRFRLDGRRPPRAGVGMTPGERTIARITSSSRNAVVLMRSRRGPKVQREDPAAAFRLTRAWRDSMVTAAGTRASPRATRS